MVPIAFRFSDGIGIGEATYSFDRGDLFQLTDGNILFAEMLAVGMRFRLQGRMTAEVTRTHGPRVVSRKESLPDIYGNRAKPVRGTVKYSGHYPGMTVELGDMRIETTPGHLFYSMDRRGWCEVESFRIGERMRQENGRPRPVTRLGEIEYGYKELYGLEVEDFHTFFVGQGKLPGEAVWTHNGLANGGCAIPKPERAGLFDHLPDPDGPIGSGVRTLRPQQYNPDAILPGQIIRATNEIRTVVGDALVVTGKHSEPISGIYSFIRQGGGAGFQGVIRNPLNRLGIVLRNFGQSAGEVVAAVDVSQIASSRVFDFRSTAVRDAFVARYANITKRFDILAGEGVIAIRGDIPAEALTGLVRIPKQADAAAQRAALIQLLGGAG